LLFSLKQVHSEQQKKLDYAFQAFAIFNAFFACFVNNQFGKIISQNP